MVRLTRIYTKGGDKGRTSLGGGKRVPKHALRVEAYGTVDEANAAIGIARLHASKAADAMLVLIQNDLFDLGADLCRPGTDGLRVADVQVGRLEREIDGMNAKLKPLDSFVLPGGTPSAACHDLRISPATMRIRPRRGKIASAACPPEFCYFCPMVRARHRL